MAALVLVVGLGLIACTPQLGADTRGWSPVAAGNGVVYVATIQGEVKALIDNGSHPPPVKWTFSATDDSIQGAYHPPVVGEDLVYVSAIDGSLYALEKETGMLGATGWRRPQDQAGALRPLVGGPALDPELGIVVVGSEDHNLYAYDAQTGNEQWRFAAGDKIWSTPVIHNGTIYFGSHDHNVYAVDAITGEEKWRFATGGAVVARPLVWRDMVVIGSFDRKLYAIGVEDGARLWEFEAGNWFWAGVVANNNTIFAPSMDGNIYALSRTGAKLWQYQPDPSSPVVSDPVLTARGLVVAYRNGRMELLNTSPEDIGTSRVITSLLNVQAEIKAPLYAGQGEALPNATSAQAAPAGQEDSIYVGAQDGTVRRIRLSDTNILWCIDTGRDQECE